MNHQLPEKRLISSNLEVTEIFDTLQGEGPFVGTPATFVRLAGCNLQCTWCDTEYTKRTLYAPSDILAKCANELVVLTGGEPLRQRIAPLVAVLMAHGHTVQIETNGVLFDDDLATLKPYVVVCPKTASIDKRWQVWYNERPRKVYFKSLFGPAFPSQPDNKGGIPNLLTIDYIMPLDVKDEQANAQITNDAIAYCMRTQTKLTVQLHKLLGLP